MAPIMAALSGANCVRIWSASATSRASSSGGGIRFETTISQPSGSRMLRSTSIDSNVQSVKTTLGICGPSAVSLVVRSARQSYRPLGSLQEGEPGTCVTGDGRRGSLAEVVLGDEDEVLPRERGGRRLVVLYVQGNRGAAVRPDQPRVGVW